MTDNKSSFFPLDGLAAFQVHALKALQQGRGQLTILSATLDEELYNTDEFRDAVRVLVTRDRYAQARFLVKDTRPLVENGHRLLNLSRRLEGKVEIRKLTTEPQNNSHAWMIVDNATLLYQHDADVHLGYADYAALPKCMPLLEEFTTLWELYGEQDPNLRQQLL